MTFIWNNPTELFEKYLYFIWKWKENWKITKRRDFVFFYYRIEYRGNNNVFDFYSWFLAFSLSLSLSLFVYLSYSFRYFLRISFVAAKVFEFDRCSLWMYLLVTMRYDVVVGSFPTNNADNRAFYPSHRE